MLSFWCIHFAGRCKMTCILDLRFSQSYAIDSFFAFYGFSFPLKKLLKEAERLRKNFPAPNSLSFRFQKLE
jgi:hypothetical protein